MRRYCWLRFVDATWKHKLVGVVAIDSVVLKRFVRELLCNLLRCLALSITRRSLLLLSLLSCSKSKCFLLLFKLLILRTVTFLDNLLWSPADWHLIPNSLLLSTDLISCSSEITRCWCVLGTCWGLSLVVHWSFWAHYRVRVGWGWWRNIWWELMLFVVDGAWSATSRDRYQVADASLSLKLLTRVKNLFCLLSLLKILSCDCCSFFTHVFLKLEDLIYY